MSLFQAREYWSVRGNEQAHCCVVCNVDNEPGGHNKIVIGSLDGMLRMYYPRRREYRVDDLILEKVLEGPILQLSAGKFVAGSRDLCLAVLHPKRIAIFMVSASMNQQQAVNYYNTIECYGHELLRPAFNFCQGAFAQQKNYSDRDFLCVQSLDAVLQFFEQDAPAFKRALPQEQFLSPNPLLYIPKTDSFVTADSCMYIHAYRYSVLAAAADNVAVYGGSSAGPSNPGDAFGQTTFGGSSSSTAGAGAAGGSTNSTSVGGGKKVQVDWSVNLGEHAEHLFFARMLRSNTGPNPESIVVVGERHLYYLKADGETQLTKRLDYEVSCATVYPTPGAAGSAGTLGSSGFSTAANTDSSGTLYNLMLGTHSGHLLIFRETQIIWCAQLGHVPISVDVAEVAGVRGMITTLDEDGLLQVSYLGTDPPPAALVNTETKELNYAAMEEEHQQLLATIRESHGEGRKEPTDRLVMHAQVQPHCSLEEDADDAEEFAQIDGVLLEGSVRIVSSLQGAEAAEKLTFCIEAPECFAVSQKSLYVNQLKSNSTPLVVTINFKIVSSSLCSSLTARASCCYLLKHNQEPRVSSTEFEIPLSWVVKPIPPIKTATYKIQFDCSRTPPPLTEVFSDLFEPGSLTAMVPVSGLNPATSSNILSLQYLAGTNFTVTILVSKSAGRISVQSGEFGALFLICHTLCERLSHHRCDVSFQDSLPLHDYFSVLDDHFSVRRHLASLRTELADRTKQYRVIQKRLLLRYKDRANPAPLGNLDSLLQLTYENISSLAETIEDAEKALSVVTQHLQATTKLVLLLIQYRFDLQDDVGVLHSYFGAISSANSTQQGWEELIEYNLDHLLKCALVDHSSAGTTKKQDQNFLGNSNNPLKMPSDLNRLKKRITTMIDRLANGVRIAPSIILGGEEEDD
ncbi:unnamed protein product [Amoebophrya sp. A120]|nr:unnamed protein product [Amoebophrya sp. A120]|eukprot:GSA120T00006372001.1